MPAPRHIGIDLHRNQFTRVRLENGRNYLTDWKLEDLPRFIQKLRPRLGRTALVQCALIAQRYSPYLKRYSEKIKMRRGTGKAIIALARKLLGIIYRTLKNKWIFEDFANFVLAEAA